MIQAVVAAQQAVLNTGCERDGVIGIHVLRWINEICHDGESTGFSETVSRDVVQAWLNIEEVHFFIVTRAGGPRFHLHSGFLPFVAVLFKPGFTPPEILGRWWTVVGNTNVHVAPAAVGFDAQISQRFGDVHVVVIRIEVPAREGIPSDFLIGNRNALLEFRHVVKRRGWVCDVSIQFDVEILNIAVQHHREPHHALGRPRPCFVEESELAKGFGVVVPLVRNFIRLSVDGVFSHLFEVHIFE